MPRGEKTDLLGRKVNVFYQFSVHNLIPSQESCKGRDVSSGIELKKRETKATGSYDDDDDYQIIRFFTAAC